MDSSKVTRQKLVENSRQKFYDNLNQHYKDNKSAQPLESSQAENKNTRVQTATSASRPAWGAPKQTTATAQNEKTKPKIPRPQSSVKQASTQDQEKSSKGLNKDLPMSKVASRSSLNSKKQENTSDRIMSNKSKPPTDNKEKDQSVSNKTAPNFSSKMPYSMGVGGPIKPSANMSGLGEKDLLGMSSGEITTISKRAQGFRDQLIEQIKENIGNPKILKELQQKNTS